jgi:hypothetical protein
MFAHYEQKRWVGAISTFHLRMETDQVSEPRCPFRISGDETKPGHPPSRNNSVRILQNWRRICISLSHLQHLHQTSFGAVNIYRNKKNDFTLKRLLSSAI